MCYHLFTKTSGATHNRAFGLETEWKFFSYLITRCRKKATQLLEMCLQFYLFRMIILIQNKIIYKSSLLSLDGRENKYGKINN